MSKHKHSEFDNDDDLRSISPDTVVSSSSDDFEFHQENCQKHLDSINRRLARVGELNQRIHNINESIFHKQKKLQLCIKQNGSCAKGGKRTKRGVTRRRRKSRATTYRKKN